MTAVTAVTAVTTESKPGSIVSGARRSLSRPSGRCPPGRAFGRYEGGRLATPERSATRTPVWLGPAALEVGPAVDLPDEARLDGDDADDFADEPRNHLGVGAGLKLAA